MGATTTNTDQIVIERKDGSTFVGEFVNSKRGKLRVRLRDGREIDIRTEDIVSIKAAAAAVIEEPKAATVATPIVIQTPAPQPNPQQDTVQKHLSYEVMSKSVGGAFALELLTLPGIGFFYADEPIGGALVLVGTIGGLAMIFAGGDDEVIIAGAVLVLAIRLGGLVGAPLAAWNYNETLRKRLGIIGAVPARPQSSLATARSFTDGRQRFLLSLTLAEF